MDDQSLLEERVRKLESRIDILEKRLGVYETIPKQTPTPKVVPKTQPSEVPLKKPVEWDVLIFQKILPRLFIFVLIIGVLWGFKAVSDYGILTDMVKVIGGFILGALFIIFGMIQLKQSRNVLGQVLIGGAIPVFMLTTFAMHQLYDMTGPELAFGLNIIWIAIGGYFTYRYRSQGIGIISSIGGVFVPFLIESTSPNIPVFVFYETILYVSFLWLALRFRYNVLYYLSTAFLHVALLFFFINVNVVGVERWFFITPIVAQQLALLIGFFTTKNMLKVQAYTLFSSVILTALWLDSVLTDYESATVFGMITLLYAGLYFYKQKDDMRASIFIANALIAFLFFIQMLESNLTLVALIGASILYMFIAKKYKSVFHALLSGLLYFVSFINIFSSNAATWFSWEMLHWIVFLGGTGFAIYYLAKITSNDRKMILNVGLTYFAFLLLIYTSMISPIIAWNTSGDTERMIMSGLWILISIIFMIGSQSLAIPQGKYIGVGVLFFTLGKIIIVDIYFVSIGVKAILFIALGFVGLIISRAYYKKEG